MSLALEEAFMQRAICLAQYGLGKVSPNPLVGSVLAYDGRILSEGWHREYGGAHAEGQVLSDLDLNVAEKRDATLYISLEPCAHTGKTPPCVDLILSKGIRRVRIACLDPHPLVSGRGLRKLREAGVDTEVGLCASEARDMNRRFFTFLEKRRPYIILKWTQTHTGYLAPLPLKRVNLSHSYAATLTHQWRAEEDAIWVGYRTAVIDSCQLSTRHVKGKNPIRILWDKDNSLPSEHPLRGSEAKTYIYTGNLNFPEDILKDLYDKSVQSVVVEGGRATLSAFLEKGYWDEIRRFWVPKDWDKGLEAPLPKGRLREEVDVGTDRLEYWVPKD
ncbi:MAG: bifunctional diaminohydroxyphosphoribosylaminopyrimidine deaminase/5-amino-6-(5-phosphoribosylamino)uracil reductase RibD [Cytophagales bacterium]|nr:bifunctional diaminohydroxyphosphoribosylaminopyrimidine deaminase/5-amino-6-(5-phosphoribosylamino)uracil reductase RibD [Cytophagales bacterium]